MAIDPSIITDTMARWQTPAAFDPLAQYAKIQALKSGIIEQQVNQARLADIQAQAQQRQADLADDQTVRQAMGDPDTAKALAAWRPGQPFPLAGRVQRKTIDALQTHILTGAKTAMEMDDAEAKQAETRRIELGKAMGDLMYDKNGNPRPDDYIQANLPATFQGLQARKLIPQDAPMPQNATFDTLDRFATANAFSGMIHDEAIKRQTAAEQLTEKKQTNVKTAQMTQKELDNEWLGRLAQAGSQAQYNDLFWQAQAAGVSPATLGTLPAMWSPTAGKAIGRLTMSPKEIEQANREETTAAQTATHQATLEQQGRERIRIAEQNLALRKQELANKAGGDYASLSPGDKQIAEKIASGDMSVTALARIPNRGAITGAALELNPAWTQNTFATKQAFTDPKQKQSQNLGTIARIVGHIGQFEKNSEAMGFAPVYASGVNLTGGQAKLNEDAHAISAELEKLLSGGVGSVSQIKAWQQGLHSPTAGARQQAIDEISKLIGSQFEGMNQAYKAGTGSDLPVEKYVNAAGRQWMRNKNIQIADEPAAPPPTTAPTTPKNPFR